MEKVIDKLESYNIFNFLLPGAVFDYMFEMMFKQNLVSGNIIEDLFMYYFLGMILSRIGSIIIEPVCKKIKWIKYADYKDYINASKKDEMVKVLSEVNNTYRTLFSGGVVLIVMKIYFGLATKLNVNSDVHEIMALIFVVILFAFSYRKQTRYVNNRVKKIEGETSK